MSVRLPGVTDRTMVVGMTGTGKTRFGVFLLSKMPLDKMPWVIVDYKNDELINGIARAEYIDYDSPLPDKPGIYILKMSAGEDEMLSDFFNRVQRKTGIGIFVDEGLMVGGRNQGFRSLLTQGRSLHVPMIVLSQRPFWVDKFVRTESTFMVYFRCKSKDDQKAMADFMGDAVLQPLPRYHSYYFDVAEDELTKMRPVPGDDEILAGIDALIPRKRRTL